MIAFSFSLNGFERFRGFGEPECIRGDEEIAIRLREEEDGFRIGVVGIVAVTVGDDIGREVELGGTSESSEVNKGDAMISEVCINPIFVAVAVIKIIARLRLPSRVGPPQKLGIPHIRSPPFDRLFAIPVSNILVITVFLRYCVPYNANLRMHSYAWRLCEYRR